MDVTKEDFMSYEDVRMSGVTNMFNVRAVEAYSNLPREVILDIMEHYSQYKKWLQDKGYANMGKVISGTGKVGSVLAHYDDIVTVYGKPFTRLPENKIDVQWIVETEHGVATIHNYKDGIAYLGDKGKDVRVIKEWSVGAKNRLAGKEVAERIYDYVKERIGG